MKRGRRAATKAISGAVLLLGPAWVHATHQTASWLNYYASFQWSDPSNWSTDPQYPHNNGADTFDVVIDAPISQVIELDLPVTISGLSLSSGAIYSTKTLTIDNSGSWLGGYIAGAGTININGAFWIGGSSHGMASTTFNVGPLGTVTWGSHPIRTIVNNAGGDLDGGVMNNAGVFDDRTDDGWFWHFDGMDATGTAVFNNSGIYVKSAGSANSLKKMTPIFNNSGWIDLQTSDLWLSGGGLHTGSISVAAGARLLISDYYERFAHKGAPPTLFDTNSVIRSDGTVVFANHLVNSYTDIFGTYDSAFTVVDADPTHGFNGGSVTFRHGSVVNTNIIGKLQVLGGAAAFHTIQPGGVRFSDVELTAGEIRGNSTFTFDSLAWTRGILRGVGDNSITTGSLWDPLESTCRHASLSIL